MRAKLHWESTKCPWIVGQWRWGQQRLGEAAKKIFFLPSTTPTLGDFALSPLSLAARDQLQDGGPSSSTIDIYDFK